MGKEIKSGFEISEHIQILALEYPKYTSHSSYPDMLLPLYIYTYYYILYTYITCMNIYIYMYIYEYMSC